MASMEDNTYMTRAEVAALFGVSVRSVDRYAELGLIRRVRVLRQVRFLRSEMLDLFENPVIQSGDTGQTTKEK